jgi:hypothetical protein
MCIADLIEVEYRSADELTAWKGREWRDVLGPEVPIICLRADICRSDLLVEIEAVGHCRQAPEG